MLNNRENYNLRILNEKSRKFSANYASGFVVFEIYIALLYKLYSIMH